MKQGGIKTVRLLISGRVQGVGYRQWLAREAKRAGVAGWIRNREDGAVEAVLQGERDRVDQLVNDAWNGPMPAHVTDIEEKEIAGDTRLTAFIVIQ